VTGVVRLILNAYFRVLDHQHNLAPLVGDAEVRVALRTLVRLRKLRIQKCRDFQSHHRALSVFDFLHETVHRKEGGHASLVRLRQQERVVSNLKFLSDLLSENQNSGCHAHFYVALKVGLATFEVIRHEVELHLFRRLGNRKRNRHERVE